MRRFAPLLTLLAVAVLGGALLTLNVVDRPRERDRPATAAAASQPAVAAAPPPAAPPADQRAARPAPAVAEKAYAGRSAGNEVTVAIAVKDGRAVGYVCDGKKIEAWLEGTRVGVGPHAQEQGRQVDDRRHRRRQAVVRHGRGQRQGVAVRRQGRELTRRAVRGPRPGARRAQPDRLDRQLQDGSQTGVWNRGTDKVAAPVLDPARPDAVVIDGVPVTVRTIGGGDAVIAR